MFLRRRREQRETIDRLYGAIVAQARLPAFYAVLGVPDTPEGRLELIMLHVILLWRRLASDGAEARTLGQEVFDRFCEDMDASLRELGVGELSVPRKMRAIGEAYFGRSAAYESALSAIEDRTLAAALQRNIYDGDAEASLPAIQLARYVRRVAAMLTTLDAAAIARSELPFPRPEED
jgi:cytochrome b pre-mRNA-processing protein 3